jgi:hypothetical protein
MENRLTKIEDIAPIVRFLVTEGHWYVDGLRLHCVELLLTLRLGLRGKPFSPTVATQLVSSL